MTPEQNRTRIIKERSEENRGTDGRSRRKRARPSKGKAKR